MSDIKVYEGSPWHADETDDSVRIFCNNLQIIKAPKADDIREPYWPEPYVLCWMLDVLNAASAKSLDDFKSVTAEALDELKLLQASNDTETAHYDADRVLCKILRKFGYHEIVTEYEKIDKWYA